jgi:hypothetical protein
MEQVSNSEGQLRWQVRTVGKEGFELGLDEVTPVSWTVVRSAKSGNALYSYALPEPDTDEFKNWLQAHRGKVVIASVRELRSTIQTLRNLS